jgi:hypothetical protein
VGPGQVQVLAQDLNQEASWLDVHLPTITVDDERDVLGHNRTSFPCGTCG